MQRQPYLIHYIRTPPWLNHLAMKSSACLLGWSAVFHLFSMSTLVGVCLTTRKAGKRLFFHAFWLLSFVAGLGQIRLYLWLLVVLDHRRNANIKKADQNLRRFESCVRSGRGGGGWWAVAHYFLARYTEETSLLSHRSNLLTRNCL